MTSATLPDQWKQAAAAAFEGWDFSYLDGRFVEHEPPWNYPALAKAAVAQAHDILDVATGGGEILVSLAPFPGRATAVEGYLPNLSVARRRLEPLGVPVFEARTRTGFPFEDASFDLILNRHGGLRADETYRVLKPGGVFLTQQVAGDNLADLAEVFGADMPAPNNTLPHIRADFAALGCTIRRAEEWCGPVVFHDVGALIYFLKAVPWVVQGFDVERHRDVLDRLQSQLDEGRPLQFTYTRFLLEAVRPS